MTYPVTGGKFVIGGDGDLKETVYKEINAPIRIKKDNGIKRGVEIRIAFQADNGQYNRMVNALTPGASAQTARVSLVQICQDNIAVVAGANAPLQQANAGFHLAQVADGSADDGTRVDQDFFSADQRRLVNTDPRYAQRRLIDDPKTLVVRDSRLSRRVKELDDYSTQIPGGADCAGWGGQRTGDKFSIAMLLDQPGPSLRLGPNADTATGDMRFEIGVLFEATNRTPAFWGGSITWGFHIDPTGAAVVDPIGVFPGGGLSPRFGKAIAAWNAQQVTNPANNAQVQLLPLP
jgi:hypothetical protein